MNIDRKFFNIIYAICFCVLLSFGSKEISAQSSSPLNADLLDGILSSMSGEIEFDKLINSMEGDVVSGALDYIDNAYSDSYNYYGGNYSGNGSGYSYRHLIPGSATLQVIGMVTSRFGYRHSLGRMHRG
ncbi:MAG: hypothetical protein K2J87_02025, partial [Muribaculaceae bacterium]|nr:hypothetical protein [Muribaculaceae bacterium]